MYVYMTFITHWKSLQPRNVISVNMIYFVYT